MSDLVADCPRCGADRITFDLLSSVSVGMRAYQNWHEAFCVCRNCHRSTVFLLAEIHAAADEIRDTGLARLKASVNNFVKIDRYLSLRDADAEDPPDHVPERIATAFREGAVAFSAQCFNAAACMFRQCLDHATKDKLPLTGDNAAPKKAVYSLGFRLEWLFANGLLPEALKELSDCVKEDGNDGAHDGTLTKADAEDLRDFTVTLLERLFTEPAHLLAAKARRDERRKPSST